MQRSPDTIQEKIARKCGLQEENKNEVLYKMRRET